jgi:hypothetical protein
MTMRVAPHNKPLHLTAAAVSAADPDDFNTGRTSTS